MKHIISIASHKGGVGKTTTALNLAFSLSRIKPGVLTIDCDPQGALGLTTNLNKKNRKGLVDFIAGRASINEVITKTKDGKMSMVGIGQLAISDLYLLETAASTGKLGELLNELSEGYDFVFLDAPAGVGTITRALLSISTGVIMPINSKNTTAKSIPLFLRVVEEIKKIKNPKLELLGMVITMLDYSNGHEISIRRDLLETLPADIFFNSFIVYNSKYEEASLSGLPVAMLKGGEDTAKGYMNLAMELITRILTSERSEDDVSEELF